MYTLRTYINHPFWKLLYEKLKRLLKQLITFSFFYKNFLKWFINICFSISGAKKLYCYCTAPRSQDPDGPWVQAQ